MLFLCCFSVVELLSVQNGALVGYWLLSDALGKTPCCRAELFGGIALLPSAAASPHACSRGGQSAALPAACRMWGRRAVPWVAGCASLGVPLTSVPWWHRGAGGAGLMPRPGAQLSPGLPIVLCLCGLCWYFAYFFRLFPSVEAGTIDSFVRDVSVSARWDFFLLFGEEAPEAKGFP